MGKCSVSLVSLGWNDYIFQFAGRYNFVMPALIALSSMHEFYSPGVGRTDHLQSDTLLYYNKTIRNITRAKEEDLSIDTVLISHNTPLVREDA